MENRDSHETNDHVASANHAHARDAAINALVLKLNFIDPPSEENPLRNFHLAPIIHDFASELAQSLHRTPEVQEPHWDEKTEARNKWIYEQCMAGEPYKAILIQLRRDHQDWAQIESINGVKSVAKRYAEVHGLAAPPLRKRGRPENSAD